jgi:drug/metabolite transporter (DMT)-like permease
LPVLMLILATAGWGLSFPVAKALLMVQQQAVPAGGLWFLSAQTMVWRFGGAALLMAVIWWRDLARLRWLDVQLGLGIGLTGGLGMLLQMAALDDAKASTVAFLTQFYVLLIPAVLAVYQRRWPHWLVVVSCLLVIIGMGILCEVDWRHIALRRGEWFTVLASVIFVGMILWLDRRAFEPANKINATVVMFVVVAGMVAPVAFWTAPQLGDFVRANNSWLAVGLIAGLVVVASILPFVLMTIWQPRVTPTQAGLAYCGEPVFASLAALALPAWLGQLGGFDYPNEGLTFHLLVGGLLVTLANILIQLAPAER